jgi:hypothetical protein
MRITFLFLCLVSAGVLAFAATAQEPGAGVIFFQQRKFKIPFKLDQRGVVQAKLYYSTDRGQHWQHVANAAPEEQYFSFATPTDGLFWFSVQTVDVQGKHYPPSADDLRPYMRLVVDTLPPVVHVRPLPPRAGEVGVAWTVRDDNLDLGLPDSIRVEYRPIGSINWVPLAVPAGASQLYWNPQTPAQLEVRVLARDRAGNVGEDKTNLVLQGQAGVNPPPFHNPVGPDPFKEVDRKFVNNKQISLSYDLREVGPSGVSSVELWYTLQHGKVWNKLTDYPLDLKTPLDARDSKKLTFEVNDEGVYGITLVAKSGVGLGDRPPQPGEKPQFWIEVDLTRPTVQLHDVKVGTGFDKGKLTIDWKATDKNLGLNPIRLSYADDKAAGQWHTIVDKLANNGRYIWRMPEALPYQFYLKVEAIDRAGNIGEAITLDRVKVDLSQPKAKILDIGPGGP